MARLLITTLAAALMPAAARADEFLAMPGLWQTAYEVDGATAGADEELHVHRLEQVKVQRSGAHMLHEPLERRREHQAHAALDEVVDTEEDDHLRQRPAVHSRRVTEHHQHRGDARADHEEHLEDAEIEVAAVLHLELELRRGERAKHAQIADH